MDQQTGISSSLFQRILDGSSNAIYVVEAETGNILEVNKTVSDMVGWTRDELIGKHISEIEVNFSTTISWDEFIEEARDLPSFTVKGEHVRKDGSSFPVKVDNDLMTVDGREVLLATVRDVGEMDDNRDELIDHYSHYSTLFKYSPVGLWELDLTEVLDYLEDLEDRSDDFRTLLDERSAVIDKCIELIEFRDMNSRALEIFGIDTRETFLDNLQYFVTEDVRERLKTEILHVLGGVEKRRTECRTRTIDDDNLHLHIDYVAPPNQNDDLSRMFVALFDITEKKETERELQKSRNKFRQLAENINEVFWLTDSDKNILYLSPDFEDVWGIPVEDVYEDPELWLDYVHPEDREGVGTNLAQRQAEGNYDEEYRVVRPDGTIRWIHDRAFPITDDDGNVIRLAGIAEDVTEYRQLQEEQEAFFDVSLDLFAIADLGGEFLKVNSSFKEKLGFSEEELTSRPYLEFVHPDDVEETREQIEELRDGRSIMDFDNRFRTSEGSYRWLNWRATPVDNLVYAAARDVTDRREREEKLQATLEEKKILLEEVHHRVKNNLQVINSLLNMQQRSLEDETLRQELNESINRIKSMALIHEKLYQSETLDQINLAHYLRDLSQHLSDVHRHDTARIDLNFDLDTHSLVLDKAIPCGLILNELLMNAFEYAFGEGQPGEITVSYSQSDSSAALSVEDNGTGFSEIADNGETSDFGLTLVKTLAEYELNGSLRIDEQEGTRVEVTFPVRE